MNFNYEKPYLDLYLDLYVDIDLDLGPYDLDLYLDLGPGIISVQYNIL